MILMDEFKRNLKLQKIGTEILSVLSIIMIVVLVFLNIKNSQKGYIPGYQDGSQIGLLTGILIGSVYKSFKIKQILNDSELLAETKIKQDDERLKLIKEKAAYMTGNIELISLTIAMFITTFIDAKISITIQVIIIFIVLVRFVIYKFYQKKY